MSIDSSIRSLINNSTPPPARGDYEAMYRLSPSIDLSELHSHGHYEIYFHIRGGHMLYVNGASYIMEPGTFAIFPPGLLHGFVGGRELINYERAFVYITPALIAELGRGLTDFSRILAAPRDKGPYLCRMDASTLGNCVEIIKTISEAGTYTPETRLRDLACLTLLLLNVDGALSQSPAVKHLTAGASSGSVKAYIDENFNHKLTIGGLAAKFCVSESSLCHSFRKNTGETIYTYILKKRVLYARELMESGTSSTEAAYKSGFGSYSNFLRAFEKFEGRTPREAAAAARIAGNAKKRY